MKKKILAFTLMLAFILSMAASVSAATFEHSSYLAGCYYHTFNICKPTYFQSMIELDDGSVDYNDYEFFVRADTYYVDERGYMRFGDRYEAQSTRIANVGATPDYTLYSIVCTQKINNTTVFDLQELYAS